MVMKLKSGFEILRFSDLSYNEMTVEIKFQNEQVCQINMDKGVENLEVELFKEYLHPEKEMKFKLNDLIEVLKEAEKILLEYVK